MPINLGDVTSRGDWYQGSEQGIIGPSGRVSVAVVAQATITDTLQIVIPLYVYAPGKPLTLQGKYPPITPLSIPVGGQIERVDFRLPRALLPQEEYTYGLQLPKNTTMIGTTGDKIKVSPTTSTTYTVTAPTITAASSAYAPGASAVLSRAGGVADASSPSLLTTVSGSPLLLGVAVSATGNDVAGTGIRLSTTGAIAYIYVRVIYSLAGDAVDPTLLPFPYAPDTSAGG